MVIETQEPRFSPAMPDDFIEKREPESLEVAAIIGCCEVVVDHWQKRYEEEAFRLGHSPGRGRHQF
jgi:hypothetical protein